VLLNSISTAEDTTSHFVPLPHDTTQHNTTHTVHTTHSLKFTSHKHANSEPHTVPSIQYMYETTLLELLNCAILCSLTTAIGRFFLHELQMVKL
jgi:hypothetical protein